MDPAGKQFKDNAMRRLPQRRIDRDEFLRQEPASRNNVARRVDIETDNTVAKAIAWLRNATFG